ncbi:MAG TPA: signal peptidase I, partial [Planctomycetaceae bacterium]|nr:signal peptidase I [Planctomycetaceae bacterium]
MPTPRKTSEHTSSSSRPDASGSAGSRAVSRGRRELRETMEAIAVAFVLAFLFRTFEAEAFVIPTGSMAPTLFGRHKDVECPECGYRFQAGASEEVDSQGSYLLPGRRIHYAACPNCRFAVDVLDEPAFTGDRILVNKFPYEIGDPSRWDVFVFKYPEDPKTNYIKRLVGLPDETIEIRQGDLYRRMPDGTSQILRKDDPDKQRELQIPVYENDFPERSLHQHGWPQRWAPMTPGNAADDLAGWTETASGWQPQPDRSFEIAAEVSAGGSRWIRYRHIVPTRSDWRNLETALAAGREPVLAPRPRLISDFCAYNETSSAPESASPFASQSGDASDDEKDAYWVGDLTVS